MNARKSRGLRDVLLVAACAAIGADALLNAAVEELQYEGLVVVGPDGNGWVSARFPTTVGGDDVTYYLDVWIGCGGDPAIELEQACPPPVKALGVTLNGEVVFRKVSLSAVERTEIVLNLAGTSDNEITVSAEGDRGAAARFAVVSARRE